MDVLKRRRKRKIGLKNLVIRSCRVHKDEYRSELRKLVKKVKWDNINVMGSDYGETGDDADTNEPEDEFADFLFSTIS